MSLRQKTSELTAQGLDLARNKMWIQFGIISLILVVVFALDRQAISLVREHAPEELYAVGDFLEHYGNLPLYIIFAFFLIFSHIKKKARLNEVSWAYIKTQFIFSFLVVRILKIFFGRLRPKYGSAFTFFSLEYSRSSFPSGHAADAVVSGVFLFYLLKYSKYSEYRFLPLIYAAAIALSRIVCYAHFPSDVMVGMGIGVFGAQYFLDKLPAGWKVTGQ